MPRGVALGLLPAAEEVDVFFSGDWSGKFPSKLSAADPYVAACLLIGNRRRTLAQERRAILARLACDGMRV
jgi:hypothetical protein